MKETFLIAGALGIALILILLASSLRKEMTTDVPLSDNSEQQKTMLATVHAIEFEIKNSTEQRTLLDVRTPEEYAQGHIAGAINIDFYSPSFQEQLSELDTQKPYSIYCRSGNRSGQALEIMQSMGFTDVLDLKGGVGEWMQQGKKLCMDC